MPGAQARSNRRAWLADYAWLAIGGLLYALAINAIILPNRVAQGGLTGLSIVIHYLTGLPLGGLYFAFNLPLLAFGWRAIGREFMTKTVIGAAVVSAEIEATAGWAAFPMDDRLLATLYAGGLLGFGMGLMFRSGGSSGGLDIVVKFLSTRFGLPAGQVFAAADGLILATVALVLGPNAALYSFLISFIAGRVLDYVQEGPRRAKAALIITRETEAVKEAILFRLDRGATLLPARGAFSSLPREVLLVAMRRNELLRLKRAVEEIDPEAFLLIFDIAEVLGEGFEPGKPKRVPPPLQFPAPKR